MTTTTKSNVVTRFAPSPTGFLHIGSIRTALFAYLWAKKNNGTFILRIEDTDKAREVDGAIDHIISSLQWLGIEWEYGPDKPGPFGSCIQSERTDVYKAYGQKLVDKGLAYPDPYTTEEVAQFRADAEANGQQFLFRNHRPEQFMDWDGTQPLRLKVPEIKRYTWQDAVRGELSAGEEVLDDVVLIKADGLPTYTFSHIVDDAEMGVTHVMRGDEFISSTARFLSIYDALEIPQPVLVTLPPIMRADGTKKLGKRDGAKDVLDYKKDGYLPEAIVNFLALIGWNPGTDQEFFTKDELVDTFSIDRIQKSGGAFNEEKLHWMNKMHLEHVSDTQFLDMTQAALPESITNLPQYSLERLEKLLPSIRERISVATDITAAAEAGEYDFAFSTPNPTAEMLAWKKDATPADAAPRLSQVHALIEDGDFSSPETIKDAVWAYAESEGRGEVLWPLRVALTGRERSPDPFSCLYILGLEESKKRIMAAHDTIVGA